MKRTGNKAGRSLLSMLLIIGLWQILAWVVHALRGVQFPGPVETIIQLVRSLGGEAVYSHTLWQHILNSLFRWLSAYLLAAFLGILSGFLLGTQRIVHQFLMPLLTVLQLIPGLAWIPIALLLFGLGNTSTIFMIFIIGYIPIAITTATGMKNTPADLLHAAQIMGATRGKLFLHVHLPAALFHIIDGLRIGLANSWRVLIAAEMVVGSGLGLGYIIIQSRWTLDYTTAFVSILVIVLIGLSAEHLVFRTLEQRLRNKYGHELTGAAIEIPNHGI